MTEEKPSEHCPKCSGYDNHAECVCNVLKQMDEEGKLELDDTQKSTGEIIKEVVEAVVAEAEESALLDAMDQTPAVIRKESTGEPIAVGVAALVEEVAEGIPDTKVEYMRDESTGYGPEDPEYGTTGPIEPDPDKLDQEVKEETEKIKQSKRMLHKARRKKHPRYGAHPRR